MTVHYGYTKPMHVYKTSLTMHSKKENTKMTSGSSQILEYLRTIPADEEFSRLSIELALPEVRQGAISGFLAKLKATGSIKLTSRKPSNGGRHLEHYIIVNLDDVTTRNIKSVGGAVGRTSTGTTSRKRLVDLLLSVAQDVEKIPVSLSDYSTRDLLKEVERRTIGKETEQ